MRKTLLDTDTFSEILKGKNPSVRQRAAEYRAAFDSYTVSAVTVMEIVKGFQRLGRPERIEALLVALASEEVIPFDREAAVIAGRI